MEPTRGEFPKRIPTRSAADSKWDTPLQEFGHRPARSPMSLTKFPPEIRLMIYKHLFNSSTIWLDHTTKTVTLNAPGVSFYPYQITLTNRLIRNESTCLLSAMTTLCMGCPTCASRHRDCFHKGDLIDPEEGIGPEDWMDSDDGTDSDDGVRPEGGLTQITARTWQPSLHLVAVHLTHAKKVRVQHYCENRVPTELVPALKEVEVDCGLSGGLMLSNVSDQAIIDMLRAWQGAQEYWARQHATRASQSYRLTLLATFVVHPCDIVLEANIDPVTWIVQRTNREDIERFRSQYCQFRGFCFERCQLHVIPWWLDEEDHIWLL